MLKVSVISSDATDLCGSGLRGILEDRHSDPTQGDRRLRSYSHTAADTAGRGDQEDRLRTRKFKVNLYCLLNKNTTQFDFNRSKLDVLVH